MDRRVGEAHLAAVILTRNVAGHITDCIATLGFADRVVVSDSFSDDSTVELARAAGAEVIQRTFDNFAGQRNAALDAVVADWIFFVDADERIPPSWRPRCGRSSRSVPRSAGGCRGTTTSRGSG